MRTDSAPNSTDRPPHQPHLTNLAALLEGPIDIKSVALTGLFIFAVLYALYFFRAFLLPVFLALLLSFLLVPVVRSLNKLRIPDGVAAGMVLLVLLGIVGYGMYELSGPAADWVANAPQKFRGVEDKFRTLMKPVEQVSKAAEEVEKLTTKEDSPPAVERERPRLSDIVFSQVFTQTQQVVGGAAVMIILLYFLLASGDLFLRKLVKVLPRLQDKKRAVEIAREIEQQISRYLFTVTAINLGLGISVGVAMYLLAMPNPLLWGVMAGLLNFIPYLGPLISLIVLSLVAILTFDDLGWALLIPLVFFCLTALEGNFITPMLHGRRLMLNPVVIFLGLIFWGWMWGIVGTLLAVPILATFKIFCDHIEPLAPIGDFLGP